MNGEEAMGARAVSDGRRCENPFAFCGLTHLVPYDRASSTDAALDQAEIHRRLEVARDRQFRALSFPAGIKTIEGMEKLWAKIDFGAKQGIQDMVVIMKVSLRARFRPFLCLATRFPISLFIGMHYFDRDLASSERSARMENASAPERQALAQDASDSLPVS